MPELSRFLGVVITMYFNDHDPPHFHARYGDGRAAIAIEPLELFEGSLSPRVLGLVRMGTPSSDRIAAKLDDVG